MILKTSAGFELAGSDLRVAVVRRVWNTIHLVNQWYVEGFGELSSEEKREALVSLLRRHRIPTSHIFLSLSHDLGMVRQVEFPVEGIEELKEAIGLQLESWCPWSSDEIYWDYGFERGPKGARSVTVSVTIVPRANLDPWLELFSNAGLRLSGACLAPLAWAHAATTLWPASPTIVLGCEPGAVEGLLVEGPRFVAVRNSGEETTRLAQESIQRIVALGRLDSPEDVRVLVHGASSDSVPWDPVRLPVESTVTPRPGVFGVLAAALVGLKSTAFRTNLVPEELRYRQNWLQWIPTGALLVLLLGLGFVYVFQDGYQNVAYAARLDAEIERLAAEVGEVSAMENELNQLNEQYEVAITHLAGRDTNLEALAELARSLPAATFLSSYSYEGNTVTISGFSESPAELQQLLEDSVQLGDVEFISPLVRDGSGKDRFVIRASVEASR